MPRKSPPNAATALSKRRSATPVRANASNIATSGVPRASRADGQLSGLAGEFFVAAELLKRGLQTSVTFGNAKSVDLLAFNAETGRSFTVQVKTVRKKNVFPIAHAKIQRSHVYVFVVLNGPTEAVQYFIVPGAVLADEPDRFTKWFRDEKFAGFRWNVLADQGFENAWSIFAT